MYDVFRVIVCENQDKYPGKQFIDIYPADFVTHELLYRMRQRVTPDVHDITGGVYLTDTGEKVVLKYVKHHNRFLQKQQELLRQKIDPKILELFYKMKRCGVKQTLRSSLNETYEIFVPRGSGFPRSAKEEELMKTQKEREKREKIMAARQAFYARQKCAYAPHLLLWQKQLERSGD